MAYRTRPLRQKCANMDTLYTRGKFLIRSALDAWESAILKWKDLWRHLLGQTRFRGCDGCDLTYTSNYHHFSRYIISYENVTSRLLGHPSMWNFKVTFNHFTPHQVSIPSPLKYRNAGHAAIAFHTCKPSDSWYLFLFGSACSENKPLRTVSLRAN